jgi:hypothetical protein
MKKTKEQDIRKEILFNFIILACGIFFLFFFLMMSVHILKSIAFYENYLLEEENPQCVNNPFCHITSFSITFYLIERFALLILFVYVLILALKEK